MSSDQQNHELIPEDIAKAVILPTSYADEERVYSAFKWLRANMPLAVAKLDGYDPVWIVTKNKDVMAVGRNANLFHNADFSPKLLDQASDAYLREMNGGSHRILSSLSYMDPPEHGKFRSITSNWFLPGRVSKLEAQIRAIAKESVETLLSFDGECDFHRDFAHYYPLRVIMSLFGVPREDEPMMLRLTQEYFGTGDANQRRKVDQEDAAAAGRAWHATLQDLYGYFNNLSAQRRAEPRDDLLSLIANTRFDGEYIGEAEANGYYVAIATAGHDTTSSSTSSAMFGLATNPDQFVDVKGDLSAVPSLIDEAVRYGAPVKHFTRNATEDTELRGQKIRAGDRLMLCYPSANRDEEIFTDPDRFDCRRTPNKHMGFGFGPHMCLGQHLAKLEMRILYEELMPHLASVELAGEPQYVQSNFVGGVKSLPIRFRKV
ncbi:MAG: cytochrome P450 [Novosphingobium sp.]